MAGTEPATIGAGVAERDAAQMCAFAKNDESLGLAVFRVRLVGLRINQLGESDRARVCDLLLSAMANEDQSPARERLDNLARGYRREIELDQPTGRNRPGVGSKRGDKGPQDGARAYGSDSARYERKVAPSWFRRRSGVRL